MGGSLVSQGKSYLIYVIHEYIVLEYEKLRNSWIKVTCLI